MYVTGETNMKLSTNDQQKVLVDSSILSDTGDGIREKRHEKARFPPPFSFDFYPCILSMENLFITFLVFVVIVDLFDFQGFSFVVKRC